MAFPVSTLCLGLLAVFAGGQWQGPTSPSPGLAITPRPAAPAAMEAELTKRLLCADLEPLDCPLCSTELGWRVSWWWVIFTASLGALVGSLAMFAALGTAFCCWRWAPRQPIQGARQYHALGDPWS